MHQKSHAGCDCSGDTIFKRVGSKAASLTMHTGKRMTSAPRGLPSPLPPAFSHRHVFKTLKFPSGTLTPVFLPQLHSLFAQVPRTSLINSEDDLLCLHPYTKRASLEGFEKSVVSKPWNRTFLSNHMLLPLCTLGTCEEGLASPACQSSNCCLAKAWHSY